ncbi:hypothetical protein KR100_01440 [Synechococcus sp. KORDI-100]|nr:hypothetical protein KR100_01440 [Synechococcus sp. KORDI-100]
MSDMRKYIKKLFKTKILISGQPFRKLLLSIIYLSELGPFNITKRACVGISHMRMSLNRSNRIRTKITDDFSKSIHAFIVLPHITSHNGDI